MIVFRIDRQHRVDDLLSGKGAELFGGRWNYPGTPAVYCASSRALAALELLVHLDKNHWPTDRIMATIEIPDSISIHQISLTELDDDWNSYPYSHTSQKVFTGLADQDCKVLSVPSAIVPQEMNYILNPKQLMAENIQVMDWEPFRLDVRLA